MKKIILLMKIGSEIQETWGDPNKPLIHMEAHERAQRLENLEKQKQKILKDNGKPTTTKKQAN